MIKIGGLFSALNWLPVFWYTERLLSLKLWYGYNLDFKWDLDILALTKLIPGIMLHKNFQDIVHLEYCAIPRTNNRY